MDAAACSGLQSPHLSAVVAGATDQRNHRLILTPKGSTSVQRDKAGRETRATYAPRDATPQVVQGVPSDQAVKPAADMACYDTGNGNPNFIVYQPEQFDSSIFSGSVGKNVSGAYLWAMYEIDNARNIAGQGMATDFDFCTVGGWKSNNGYRQSKSTVGMTIETRPLNTHLLVGANPGIRNGGSVTSNMTIEASWGPVTIGASLPAVGGGTYTGSIGSWEVGPYDPFSTNKQNTVNAWWHDNSLLALGTADPVNETSEAIYETTPDMDLAWTFPYWATSLVVQCFNPAGCG